jgi:hypothetical protein
MRPDSARPEVIATSEGATRTARTGKAASNFSPTACGCIVTFRTIDLKSWQFNSVNLSQRLNGTVFQPVKSNHSFGGGLETTKVMLHILADSICDPRIMIFLDSSGRSKFKAVEYRYSNVAAFAER